MAILELRDVTSGYGEVQILWGITLALQEGSMTSLVGANGAGKTTLLRTIMGLNRPWQGEVLFEGENVGRLSPHAKAARGLVLVPEGRQLFAHMTVLENLAMGASPQRARAEYRRNLELVFEMFPRLKDRQNQKAGTMSGGEQQMLAVARGLMASPKVLMIDELSLGLAPFLVLQLFESLKKLRETGITVLLVEQNVQMALAVTDYAYVLAEGRIEIEGPSNTVAHNPEVQRAYLGL
jgi:branched-chain amino acid transport system ATP-binding protein